MVVTSFFSYNFPHSGEGVALQPCSWADAEQTGQNGASTKPRDCLQEQAAPCEGSMSGPPPPSSSTQS